MATKNKQVIDKETGEVIWKSRSMAVTACVVTMNPTTREYNFLVERRGAGCPDYVGALAFPCGYLDWDETRRDAVIRELQEELGLDVDPRRILEWKTIDDPSENHQNVVTRYIVVVNYDMISEWIKTADLNTEARGGEKDEVAEIKLIPYSKVQEEKDWAFNHNEVIEELVSTLNIFISDDDINVLLDDEESDPNPENAEEKEEAEQEENNGSGKDEK